MAAPLVVNVAELFRAPGTVKEFTASVDARAFDFDDERIDTDGDNADNDGNAENTAGPVVVVRVRLEAASEGIVVGGTAAAAWHDQCRRCLAPVGETLTVVLEELFVHESSDPEAWRIVESQIDLAPMVREAILLALPSAPLCRPDCPGLCATCGADRSEGPCRCRPEAGDDRWGALDALRGRLPDESGR